MVILYLEKNQNFLLKIYLKYFQFQFMKKICLGLSTLILICVMACNTPTKIGTTTSLPQLGKSSLKEVIKAMTLDEKANLVIGMGFFVPGLPAEMFPPIAEADKTTPEKVVGAAGRTHAIPRLGIPSLTVSDGPAGVRIDAIRNNDNSKTYYATAFPIGTLPVICSPTTNLVICTLLVKKSHLDSPLPSV